MAGKIETTITIEESLYQQAEALAQRLDSTVNQVFETAIKQFIDKLVDSVSDEELKTEAARIINQGDIYWLKADDSDDEIPHPQVVVQENVFNHSRIPTVVMCQLTSNLKRVNMPGNILLEVGEGDLPKQSVVEVSKVSVVDKTQLGKYIGTLSEARINQILAGMRFVQASFLRG
jgi:mRNA interferase MazF